MSEVADPLPAKERYDLALQMRRSSKSMIGYVRRLKTGSKAYGDKYILATDETPASPGD